MLFVPGEQGLAAFDLVRGSAPIKRWEKPKLSPTTASPLLMNEALYTLRSHFGACGPAHR